MLWRFVRGLRSVLIEAPLSSPLLGILLLLSGDCTSS
jgi:hypothetical protein